MVKLEKESVANCSCKRAVSRVPYCKMNDICRRTSPFLYNGTNSLVHVSVPGPLFIPDAIMKTSRMEGTQSTMHLGATLGKSGFVTILHAITVLYAWLRIDTLVSLERFSKVALCFRPDAVLYLGCHSDGW